MKVYSVIPARSGSKSVVDKNIKDLNGHPVIAYSINVSKKSEMIDDCIFTSDSGYYINIADNYGVKKTIKRPKYLSTDYSTDTDYLLHVVHHLELDIDDMLVLLRPTTPIREVDVVDDAIKKYIKFKNVYTSLRTVHKLNESPEKMYKFFHNDEVYHSDDIVTYIDNLDNESANKPKESFTDCYMPNGYVDIIPVRTLIEFKTTYGDRIFGYKTEKVTEIDSQDDFDYLEYKIKKDKYRI